MILLLLAVLWIAVLTPGIIKRRAERHSATSIDSFHRELHLLERTGPKMVAPAYRLETATLVTGSSPSGLPAITSRPGRPKLVLVGKGTAGESVDGGVGSEWSSDGDGYAGVGEMAGQPHRASSLAEAVAAQERKSFEQYQRRQACKRRRDIFLALVATFVLTLGLGAVHSLRALWFITLLAGLALAAYVILVGYARRLAAERHEAERTRRLRQAGREHRDLDYPEHQEQAELLGSYRESYWRQPTAGYDGSYSDERRAVAAR